MSEKLNTTLGVEIAKKVATDYETDSRVEAVSVKQSRKGAYLEVVPKDRVVAEELKSEVDDKPVYVEFDL